MTRQMPGGSEYKDALQNLNVLLVPNHLQSYRVVYGKRGPLIYSGGFVMTSPIHDPTTNKKLALRLFYRLPDDMEKRYRAISGFIRQHKQAGIFAEIDYIEQGINIQGATYPICTMEWLEGDTLRVYVSKNINDPIKISSLASKFEVMVSKLRRANCSHGDLSHENIMMVNDEFYLVDYDGMYVPDLQGYSPVVAGQPNFQHPSRLKTPGYFGIYQDDFSAIAIYISLLALSHDASFYNKYENGGNSLLFKESDFLDPDASPFLNDIEKIPSMSELAKSFRVICKGDLLQVPSLGDFLKGKLVSTRATINPTALSNNVVFSTEGNPVFNANTTYDTLYTAQGHIGLVAGKVFKVHERTEQIVLEFRAGTSSVTFNAYIEGDAYQQIRQKGLSDSYLNAWVKVLGLIEINDDKIPAIVVDSLQDVTISERSLILSLFQTGSEIRTRPAREEAISSWRKSQQSLHNTRSTDTGNPDSVIPPSNRNPFLLDDN
jgi:hypothetical protein